jgi:hypothetical protein|tara:strand:- start:1807 stop:2223 length:417 start_codon:yes stop_codon:yes gene_type:complete
MNNVNYNNSLVKAAVINVYKSKKNLEYYNINFFGRTKWTMFLHKFYNDSVNRVNNGDTTYYKNTHVIPYGSVYKNGKVLAKSFIRKNDNGYYLMIIAPVSGFNGRKMRKYYIFDLDSNNIPTNKSSVMFDISADYWNY